MTLTEQRTAARSEARHGRLCLLAGLLLGYGGHVLLTWCCA
jgi:hypothetical protein